MNLPLLRTMIFATAACFGLSAAALTIDQSNAPTDERLNVNYSGLAWQQEVRVGIAGILAQVDLYYGGPTPGQAFGFSINRGSGWQSDPDDFYAIVQPTAATISIDVTSASLLFNAGDTFVIGVHGLGPDQRCCYLLASRFNQYKSGMLFLNSDTNHIRGYDMGFMTYVEASPVSEPATGRLALLGVVVLSTILVTHRSR